MKTSIIFRLATAKDLNAIWDLIEFAIESRKKDGSNQWQDGYPNKLILKNDIENKQGYVLSENNKILFYAALIYGKEPAYEALQKGWLTHGVPYAVIHRIASSPQAQGKGLSKIMMSNLENTAQKNKTILSE